MGMVEKLSDAKDHRIDMLKDLAFINGKDFNSMLHKITKAELPKYILELNINVQVKTEIYKAIRASYGWDF